VPQLDDGVVIYLTSFSISEPNEATHSAKSLAQYPELHL